MPTKNIDFEEEQSKTYFKKLYKTPTKENKNVQFGNILQWRFYFYI